jgi:hypothetical protein
MNFYDLEGCGFHILLWHSSGVKMKFSLCLTNSALCHESVSIWSGQFHALAALPQGKESPVLMNRRLDGRQSRSGRYLRSENSCLHRDLNFDPSAVQPVASHYTDCAIPAPGGPRVNFWMDRQHEGVQSSLFLIIYKGLHAKCWTLSLRARRYVGRTESHEQLFFCMQPGKSRRKRVRW